MRKLGLLAGIGPASTIEYYRFLIQRYQKEADTKHYPEMLLHSIDMTAMLDLVYSEQYDKLLEFLSVRIGALEKAGADFAAMASNTPHIVFDSLLPMVNIPLISIVEASCKYISAQGHTRVGLMGTRSTMDAGFYQKVGAKYGMEILLPDKTWAERWYNSEEYAGLKSLRLFALKANGVLLQGLNII